MPMTSDIVLNTSKFSADAVSERTRKLNEYILKTVDNGPKWYEIGAAKYRQMRWDGETALPKPVVLESGMNIKIPSRESGRDIPCRVFKPEKSEAKGAFLHIHGGGWVLQSEAHQDVFLKFLADSAGLAVVSVGYRLAPEDPFPAGPEDCYDAAEYLLGHSRERFGGELMFAGGESAGAHLTVLVALYLLKHHPSFSFLGLVLHFGAYDLSHWLPAVTNTCNPPLLTEEFMDRFLEVFLPNTTSQDRRHPSISPFYADLVGLNLPSALFTCGTADCLLDDTTLMATRWLQAGGEAVVKLYPGAPHGFTLFPREMSDATEQGLDDTERFVLEKMKDWILTTLA